MKPTARWFQDLYGRIYPRYERINQVITLGQDRRWRAFAAYRARQNGGDCWLDLCSGTGDMACALRKSLPNQAQVIALDFTPEMLLRAREKCSPLQAVRADAAFLPFGDATLDGVTVAFASRNLLDSGKLVQVFREAYRILRPGGVFLHLESSRPQGLLVREGFRLWSRYVVPLIGHLLSGNREGYRYLGESLDRFPPAPHLARMLEETGFRRVRVYPLFLGAVALHEAVK